MLYDTISGIKESNSYLIGTGKPEYVRWADEINIKVEMDMENLEQIFRPYLIISYKEIESKIINPSNTTRVTYSLEYFSDYSYTMEQILIAFICMNVLAVIITIIRFYYFTRRNPRSVMGDAAFKMYAFKFTLYLLDSWSEIMFWLLFFSSCSVFITFKLQMNAALLLPELGDASDYYYSSFIYTMLIVLIFKGIVVFMRIIEQSKVDIHLIDFEAPNPETKQVTGWRYLFIANEFAELQTEMRYFEPETTFIWFAFFWVGLGW